MKEGEWVVLDIDGVLLDVSRSYDVAVKRTVEFFLSREGLKASVKLKSIRNLRKKGKFGDDYKVTECLLLAGLSGRIEDFVNSFPRGKDLNWVKRKLGSKTNSKLIKQQFNRVYLGCGPDGPPVEDGLWKREEPMVAPSLLERISSTYALGVVTGRSELELTLAERILHYEFSNSVTREDYEKPDPEALASLAGEEGGVYLGDTYNDRLLVENYNARGNKFSFAMIEEPKQTAEVLARLLEG